ncbi:alpha-2-macroglobulin family protein [Puia dinghuensis]|uniref:Alpha-2-macroglobulin n=1 Tax=Puia dinghuensis TaxID=1792502 RepID=A0A8J2XU42_9BACT|nr:alpha-2-macroglobulin family protein [Puia dinghuensis]GGB04838.1 alpha-2-macroglobulin [Puia dinghuensis]
MKPIRYILSFSCFLFSVLHLSAQTPPSVYNRKWKVVDSLSTQKGLTESALAEVNRIYTLAVKEHNDAQQIKALVYRLTLAGKRSEDAEPAAFAALERSIEEAGQPAKAILQNITAGAYWNYYQANRYKLYNRTATVGFRKDDVTTWSADDFRQKIGSLYRTSLKEEKLLTQVKLADYDPVLIKGNVRYLRPTLFDVLAHAALDYFSSGEQNLDKPENVFEINDPVAFGDAVSFSEHRFTTPDTSDLHYHALLLFQQLIRLHIGDVRPDALIDVDIERLNFVHNIATMEDKDERYEAALTRLTDRWGAEPAAAEAWYLLAQQHVAKARSYDPPADTAGRYELVAAKAICERVIQEKDSSEGKVNCANLLQELSNKSLEMEVETVNLSGQPFRSLVKWQNISKLYCRIIQVGHTFSQQLRMNTSQDTFWQRLIQMPVLRSFSQALPATGDYQSHRTEMKIDALPVGEYALITCSDSSFNTDKYSKQPLSVVYFYVSAISFVNTDRDYFVLDRESGQPLAGATAQLYKYLYDNKSRRFVSTRQESYHTDEHGLFQVQDRKDHRQGYGSNFSYEITAGKDHLFIDEDGYHTFSWQRADEQTVGKQQYEKQHRQTWFFTDRSIYRPGQTLYFKGIVLTRDADSHQPKILTRYKTKVFLYDVNGDRVDSLEVTTNDFGSYHGQLRIPEHLLNGMFSIRDDSTSTSAEFSVEEYKRPSFSVGYDTLKASYRVGDSIRIEGYAKAYAGNMIDGAVVKYRVIRQMQYRWWRPFRRSGEQEVAHGTATTDKAGRFNIGFVATADKSIDKETNPVFEYTVSADVTDISGETRSGTTVVRAGYRSLQLAIDQPANDHLPADSLTRLVVHASNLSGVTVPAVVEVAIYSLRAPDRLMRSSYWKSPDTFILSREEYLRNFPHDQYGDETNPDNWARTSKVFEGTDSAGKTLLIANGKPLAPGWYVMEAQAKDKDGKPVKVNRYVALYDGVTGKPAEPQYNWSLSDGETVEPGGIAHVETGSTAGKVFVIRKVDRGDEGFTYFTLDNEKKRTALPVAEKDRGGFAVADVFVKDNRVYTHTYTVTVPWTNKQLDITYSSYRDKTLPGSEEKWGVTISGQHGDKAAAEVLAGMYDASLDQFRPHEWSTPSLYPVYQPTHTWESTTCFSSETSQMRYAWGRSYSGYVKMYDELLSVGMQRTRYVRGGRVLFEGVMRAPAPAADMKIEYTKAEQPQYMDGSFRDDMKASRVFAADTARMAEPEGSAMAAPVVQARKDFRETAFFFPDLRTDSAGNVTFSFTMPEATTSWKWMTLAHTRDLAFGYSEKTVVTQKQLMVQPNTPRFLREGDRMELPVKVVNLTDSELTGQMQLQLTDPTTGQTADGWFTNRQANQYFTVAPHQSVVVGFPLDIPYQYNRPLTYRVTAQAGNFSDGEEATLPVVSNRMLVTESLPLNMPGDGVRHFTFDKLLKSGSSETLNHHALTVEFTANPVWYAVQSLPYLMEYPHECAEQLFNRAYANALATTIAGNNPRLRQVFDQWRTADTAALLSNLQKNPELKSVLLEETPWVLEGKTEAQQKKNIALLFDLDRMSRELQSVLDQLSSMQSASGGFPWFKGGVDDRYITQYIITGIGHLQQLKAVPPALAGNMKTIVSAALPWIDAQLKEEYKEAKAAEDRGAKTGARPLGVGGPSMLAIQYLYMRSMFNDYGIPGDVLPAVSYFRKKAQQHWLEESKYAQGMIALALFRTGDVQTARDILASLKQNAIHDEEKGMYWKGMEGGYYWYQAPVETQSLLIEAFREIGGDAAIDRDLKTWLLRQKQTHNWATTKATADACYALLLGGQDWLNAARDVDISLGDKKVELSKGEAGTGYYKKVFDGAFVNPSMGNITVKMQTLPASGASGGAKAGSSPAWGAVYWQYFDMLDKITPPGQNKSALSLEKKLFLSRNTDRGPVLEPLAGNATLKPGDKVVVRIVVRCDRDLEYVHMKDMRGACFEPVNVISQYKWQDGLGYYESTKDASTDFFFGYMPRGTHVFEYPLFTGQAGNFSNGVTSIECMYAPEFSFHSEGIRVTVEGTR